MAKDKFTTYEVAKAVAILADIKMARAGETYWRAHDTVTWGEANLSLAEQTRIGDYARELSHGR